MKFSWEGEVTQCVERSLKVVLSERKFCELFFLRELRAVEGVLFYAVAGYASIAARVFCTVATCMLIPQTKTRSVHVCLCLCV